MMISRRKLIGGLGLLIAAPAVIRVAQLMPIKAWADEEQSEGLWKFYNRDTVQVTFDLARYENGRDIKLGILPAHIKNIHILTFDSRNPVFIGNLKDIGTYQVGEI